MKKTSRLAVKVLAGVSLLALATGVAALIGANYVMHRAEPVYQGTAQIAGLSASVDMFRDASAVPHIFAANRNDAARALGYAHASERLFQMEMQRRAGQGRLSEMIGADMLGVDKFIRTLGLYRLAQSSFAAMSPEAQDIFRAYADGVNAWLNTHRDRLPPEFLLLNAKPEAWVPADSVVWGKLMALDLSHNYHLEILRAKLATHMSADKAAELFPMPPTQGSQGGSPITTKPTLLPRTPTTSTEPDRKLAALLGLDHAASNEWVIGGARTQSGKPLLANDPHLGLEAPILWYLARIVTPQGSVKGATVPGLPLVLLGQNDHVAWGFTTTGSDVQDLFLETIDPQDPTHYMTPEGSMPFQTHDEVIHVKGGTDVTLPVRTTRHGPVMSDVSAEMASISGNGKVVALAFTGLGEHDLTSEAMLHVNHAANAGELLDALHLYQAPPQNIVYADDAGAFGYINAGLVPVRKNGDGLMPVDGASGNFDWVATVPFESLPQIANPAAGYVFNANNAVVGANNPVYFGQDWEEPYRARRLQQIFDHQDKFDLSQIAAMQADHLSLVATDFLPRLLAVPPRNERMKNALDLLAHWDGVMDADKAAPAVFESWLYVLHARLFAQTGVNMADKGPFAAMTLDRLMTQHAKEWCGDEDCKGLMGQSLEDALDLMTLRQGSNMGNWQWGRENVATLQHKFYKHIPILRDLSDLSVESSGDFYTLDRGGGFDNKMENPFARSHGGGYRGIYDLGNSDASLFMIATGQSDHLLSGHYGDLTSLWHDIKAITLSGSAEELRQKGLPDLVLTP